MNSKDAIGGEGVTQFGRALSELNIDIICANSPQAKGRVERAFGTLQDRLVKELRLAGISTIAAANAWLPGFITDSQQPFWPRPGECQGPASASCRRREDLDEILAWREERTVTHNLTLHYDRMMLMLDPTPLARGLVRKKVEVVNYPDGRFAVQFDGMTLSFRVFDKIRTVRSWHDRGEQAAGRGAGVGEGSNRRPSRRISVARISRGSDRRTISRRRVCRRRVGHPAAVSLRRADPVNRSVLSIVFALRNGEG